MHVLVRVKRDTETQRGRPCEDEGRHGCDVSTNQGMPWIANDNQGLKGMGSSLGWERDSVHHYPGSWHTQVFLGL